MICPGCKRPIETEAEVYRCYDCDAACHKPCLKEHCRESRQLSPNPKHRQNADLEHWAQHLDEEEKVQLIYLLLPQLKMRLK